MKEEIQSGLKLSGTVIAATVVSTILLTESDFLGFLVYLVFGITR